MVKLHVAEVSQAYSDSRGRPVDALQGISFEIAPGGALSIVGPSGSGKSTLLRLIAGLEEPSAGRISLDDRCVSAIRPEERDVFMVFQDAPLYPGLTVRQNLELVRERGKGATDQVESIAARFRLQRRLDSMSDQLSRGERQRVALGRALLSRPKLLLLDEPLASLDPELRFQLRSEIANLQEKIQATMVYVTHDPFEAATLGDRVLILDEGRLQQLDAPDRIYQSPANQFVASFVGFPPMNFMPGRVESATDGKGVVWFPSVEESAEMEILKVGVSGAITSPGVRDVTLGFRAESVRLHGSRRETATSVGFDAVVLRVEMFQGESLCYLNYRGCSLVAKLPGTCELKRGQSVAVEIDVDALRWFVTESGKRLDCHDD